MTQLTREENLVVEIRPFQRAHALLRLLAPASARDLCDRDDVCPICRMDMAPHEEEDGGDSGGDDPRSTPCGHIFHSDCLLRWLLRSGGCPYCNADLTSMLVEEE